MVYVGIHFAIVLTITAAAIELVDVVFARPAWLDTATFLYAAGAAATIAAYVTGVQAGDQPCSSPEWRIRLWTTTEHGRS